MVHQPLPQLDFYKRQKVLVSGGAGFIGSFLVSRLVNLGSQVTVMVQPGSDAWRLRGVGSRVETMHLDLVNAEAVENTVRLVSPQMVFNLAAKTGGDRNPSLLDEFITNNFLTAQNLMASAAKNNVQRFIQVGTIEEYGTQTPPFKESQREMPISPYSLSKVMATHLALFYYRIERLKASVVRLAATFGPTQGPGMLIPNLVRACLEKRDFEMNAGEQVRDLMFVDDAVDGLLAAGCTDTAVGEIINLGSSRGFKIKGIVNKVNELMDNPITIHFGTEPYRPLDSAVFLMDAQKAKRLLDWETKTDMETALRRTVEWYKEVR